MQSYDPYEPPSTSWDARPGVIIWYRIYASVVAVLMLAAFRLSAFIAWSRAQTPVYGAGAEADLVVMLLLFGTFSMLVFYGVAVFVPMRPWGWTIGLVAIALGLTSIWIVVCIPLLLKWMDPKVKAAFGRL